VPKWDILVIETSGAVMSALLGKTMREMGQGALALLAALSLIAFCAAALIVTLVCAAPLRLVQAR